MRDRQKTIEALRRLAERPGSPAEGETARRKLREFEVQMPAKTQVPLGYTQLQYERMMRAAGEKFMRDDDTFKVDLENFFRQARSPRPQPKPERAPKPKPVTWEDMEGMIRRSIFRNTPDPD